MAQPMTYKLTVVSLSPCDCRYEVNVGTDVDILHTDVEVRQVISPITMKAPFTASDVVTLDTLLATTLGSGETLAKDYSTIYTCYVNGGTGCSYEADIANIAVAWQGRDDTSPTAAPSWISIVDATADELTSLCDPAVFTCNEAWKTGRILSVNPSSLDLADSAQLALLTAAIGTSSVYFTYSTLPQSSSIYSSGTLVVASTGFAYVSVKVTCKLNAVGWSSTATEFTFTSSPETDPYYFYMQDSLVLNFNNVPDIVEEPCKSPASIIGYKVEMNDPQRATVYVSSTDITDILEIQTASQQAREYT